MRKRCIRLVRRGNKRYPVFYIVMSFKDLRANSYCFEKIGYFNPNKGENYFFLNSFKLGFWLNRGAFINKSVLKILGKFLVSRI